MVRSHEQKVAKDAQTDLMKEEAHNNYKRYLYTQEVKDLLKIKKMQKDAEDKAREMNKQDYQQKCEERYKSEEQKENEYKQFFKNYENSMNGRMNAFVKNVQSYHQSKDEELQKSWSKAEKEYAKKQLQKEVKGKLILYDLF